MLITFHGLMSVCDASNVFPLDAWRLVATNGLAPQIDLKAVARELAVCSVHWLRGLLKRLGRLVGGASAHAASCASPAPLPPKIPPFLGGSAPLDEPRAPIGAIRRIHVVRDPGSREAFDGKRDAAMGAVYVDLTDVLCHAIWHDSCAGIPRVQLEVATSLFQSHEALRIIASRRGKWFDLGPLLEMANGDVDAIFRLMREAFADLKWTPRGILDRFKRRKKFRALERLPHMPELTPRDALFVGGAFWINHDSIDLCKKSAERRANLIVLFHDLIPLIAPYFTGHDFRNEYLEILRLPAHFIVTTERNRRDLRSVRQGGDVAELSTSCSVVPLADEFPGAKRNERARPAFGRLVNLAGENFALCVGTIEVRKNHLTLILTWKELAAELGDHLPKLVIAGRRGWKAEAALAMLDEANEVGGLIQFVEAPTDAELRWLYSACQFTILPSYFEGWGLPVGESFWFGKPCAASKSGSIPFVGRDLCAYFSPFDPEEMKGAVRALANPAKRRFFQEKIQWAPLRTWAEVARDIEEIIMEPPRPSERKASPGASALA